MYSTVRETGPSFERRAGAVPMSEICLWREEFGTRTKFFPSAAMGLYRYENEFGILRMFLREPPCFHARRGVCQRRIKSPVKEGPNLIRQDRDPGLFSSFVVALSRAITY